MGQKRATSDFLKSQFVTLNAEGYSQCSIAQRLHISSCAVQNVLKLGGNSRRVNCGRRRKTTQRQDRFVKSIVAGSPHTSSNRIAQLAQECEIAISSWTVRRWLSVDLGLVARWPAKKPLMMKTQLQDHLNFCHAIKDKSAEWWERVIFTDESTLQQLRSSGYNYV